MSTSMGPHLAMPYSYLAMTRKSIYVSAEEASARLHLHPADSKYFFVYPFVKTREWYAALARRAAGDDERAHRRRPQVSVGQAEHDVLVRPRRPGVRRLVRDRRAGGLPRPRDGAARGREQPLHAARHADLHLHLDGPARSPRLTRRHECTPTPERSGGLSDLHTRRLDARRLARRSRRRRRDRRLPRTASRSRSSAPPTASARSATAARTQTALSRTASSRAARSSCPYHGSRFGLETGAPSCGPANRPVPVYDIRIEDGAVWLGPARTRTGEPARD